MEALSISEAINSGVQPWYANLTLPKIDLRAALLSLLFKTCNAARAVDQIKILLPAGAYSLADLATIMAFLCYAVKAKVIHAEIFQERFKKV